LFKLIIHHHGAEIKELELAPGAEYKFGRDASCDVQLERQPGISRTHFRLFEENGQWNVQVMAKFGEVLLSGKKVQAIALESNMLFKLGDYEFRFVDPSEAQEQAAASNNLPAAVGQSENMPVISSSAGPFQSGPAPVQANFHGNDESTRMIDGLTSTGLPYIRIVGGTGIEESMKLEGNNRWLAGREEGCDILLNDSKASRRQFEILSTPQGYFVRDLGSANGTLLNGMPMAPDELKPIRSGDVIQARSISVHFEIRDPHFARKLMIVSPPHQHDSQIVVQSPYEMIHYPVPTGPGGAVRIDGAPRNGLVRFALGEDLVDEKAKKKRKFIVLVILLLVPFLLFGLFSSNPPPPKKLSPQSEAFNRLSPAQKQMVKETYVLAKNLAIQGKLALAADELKKIHDILPEGYEGSLALAAECKMQKEQADQLEFLKREQEKRAEDARIIEKTLRDCEKIANTTVDLAQLNDCLAPATVRDPSNAQVQEYIARVQHRIEENGLEMARQKNYQSLVAKGRKLHNSAVALEQSGEYVDAIATYHKHIDSSYPDPGGLKSVSQRNLLSLSKRLSSKVEDELKGADQAFQAKNYKESMEHIKRAKQYDPPNERAAEMNAKFRREINNRLRQEYEDSIISEGLGDVDLAKKAWKKIMETDIAEGEYYKKARNKLRSYGGL
jgi:pSer/pThr/pTyr-binding forkhead associated (FHA) protein